MPGALAGAEEPMKFISGANPCHSFHSKTFFSFRFYARKAGYDSFGMFTLLVDDQPYFINGKVDAFDSCVGINIELSVGQTVKVQNRVSSTMFAADSRFACYLYS